MRDAELGCSGKRIVVAATGPGRREEVAGAAHGIELFRLVRGVQIPQMHSAVVTLVLAGQRGGKPSTGLAQTGSAPTPREKR